MIDPRNKKTYQAIAGLVAIVAISALMIAILIKDPAWTNYLARKAERLEGIANQGRIGARAGLSKDDNPYRNADPEEGGAWLQGWSEVKADRGGRDAGWFPPEAIDPFGDMHNNAGKSL